MSCLVRPKDVFRENFRKNATRKFTNYVLERRNVLLFFSSWPQNFNTLKQRPRLKFLILNIYVLEKDAKMIVWKFIFHLKSDVMYIGTFTKNKYVWITFQMYRKMFTLNTKHREYATLHKTYII
jgi:hypothetical protein